MAFKDLLIHLDTTATCAERVRLAVELAKTHEAHLTGLYVVGEPVVPAMVLGMIPEEVRIKQRRAAEEHAEMAVARFREVAEREGISFECRIAHSPDLDIASTVALHARYADLLVIGQANPDDGDTLPHLPEQVALVSGRPVLVVPFVRSATPGHLGERVLVAWDAGREATRAVHDALPLLVRAKVVHILCVNPKSTLMGHGAEPGTDIALHLARHGVRAEVHRTVAQERAEGEAILSSAFDRGADLIVAGAYGHSRMRELVLGGVTRTLLRSMTVPVLMAH